MTLVIRNCLHLCLFSKSTTGYDSINITTIREENHEQRKNDPAPKKREAF